MSRRTVMRSGGVNEDTIQDADNDTKVTVEQNTDEDKIRFTTSGVERAIIGAGGSVGIGTSSPDAALEVANTVTGTSTFQVTTTNDNGSASPIVELKRNSSSPDSGDYLGQFKFQGENDNNQQVTYAKLTAKITNAQDNGESGLLEMALRDGGSNTISVQFSAEKVKTKNGCGLEVDGNTELKGGIKKSSIRDVNSTTTATDTDYTLRCIQSGPITINLPSKGNNAGQILVIKDALGNAGTHNITLDGNGGDTIDGMSTLVINMNFRCVTIQCDGINGWMVIGMTP